MGAGQIGAVAGDVHAGQHHFAEAFADQCLDAFDHQPGASTLGQLVERILRHVPDLPRLRLSSLDCIEQPFVQLDAVE